MKVLNKKIDKLMQIASWTHILDDAKRTEFEKVLSDVYESGFADGYAEGVYDSNTKR